MSIALAMADGVRLHAGHLSAGTRKPVQLRSPASKLNIAAPLSAQRPEARSTPNTCISVIDSSESPEIIQPRCRATATFSRCGEIAATLTRLISVPKWGR
jgi:hypothetical protein